MASGVFHQPGVELDEAPGILIVPHEEVPKSGIISNEYRMSFGIQQDGTKLVMDFMKEARKMNATMVSDLEIILSAPGGEQYQNGQCVTKITPTMSQDVVRYSQIRPGTNVTQSRYVMKPVTRQVTEYQYRCHLVSKPVTRSETHYSYQYDYFSKQNRSVPHTRMVTRYETHNECRSEPVSRMVTRYEHQLESQYVPAQWDYVSRVYSKWSLTESEPICLPMITVPLPPGAKGLIRGMLHAATIHGAGVVNEQSTAGSP